MAIPAIGPIYNFLLTFSPIRAINGLKPTWLHLINIHYPKALNTSSANSFPMNFKFVDFSLLLLSCLSNLYIASPITKDNHIIWDTEKEEYNIFFITRKHFIYFDIVPEPHLQS